MSELEHYKDDLHAVDREILRAALVAGIDLNDQRALDHLMQAPVPHENTPRGQARERLRGLLFLRLKLETEELRDVAAGMPIPGRVVGKDKP
jgi:hypothetical protein